MFSKNKCIISTGKDLGKRTDFNSLKILRPITPIITIYYN